tara:strand:- start:8662 stop:8871 length:210 start_codon:yes stop_codon:yes gene_type:complete
MTEKQKKIDEIVKSHKSGEVAFHVAHTRLTEEFGLSDDDALNILFPPIDDRYDLDMIPDDPTPDWMRGR